MNVLYLRCFGRVEIHVNHSLCGSRMSRQTANLLAALAMVNGRAVDRLELASQLWPNSPERRARSALNTELWRLRQLLIELDIPATTCLRSTRHEIEMNVRPPHGTDISDFLTLTRNLTKKFSEPLSGASLAALTRAADLYRGEFHAGHFEDWCVIRRQSLEARYVTLLSVLTQASECICQWRSSIDYADRLLRLDPFMESTYRCKMRCHAALGNKAASIQQYIQCKNQLRRELGVSPSASTEALYRQIITSSPPRLKRAASPSPANDDKVSAEAVKYIGGAIEDLDHARSRLIDISEKLRSH